MASLLLRLFDSDYFSPHLALSYLKTYSDNIGITYYLVYRLRTSFPPQQVEFYWPQLCHLLITKPSDSRALECFILERCEESVHVALLTLWHLQAALYDLSSSPHTPSFQVCKRVYNECQRILYDDPLSDANVYLVPSTAGTSRLKKLISSAARAKEKVLPSNAKSTVVGMGAVLASVPGMPTLASFSGQVAVEQGRAKPKGKSAEGLADGVERITTEDDSDDERGRSFPGEDELSEGEDDEEAPTPPTKDGVAASEPPRRLPPNRSETAPPPRGSMPAQGSDPRREGAGGPFQAGKAGENPLAHISAGFNDFRDKATAAVGEAFGQTFGVHFPGSTKPAASQKPAWHPQNPSRRPQRPLARPTGNAHGRGGAAQSSTSKSVPNLNASRNSLSAWSSQAALLEGGSASVDAVLSQYDHEARRRLLRSNYCRTQTEFLLGLQDISARLLLLPKPARLSALRAELTALNHRLPAEVCFPLWCSAVSEAGAAEESQNAIQGSHAVPGAEGGPPSSPDAALAKAGHPGGEMKHHRVVRINPSEAVVLNSADRAPYLLHVEVLQNDLDFDPERRTNRESLKKLVVAEDLRRRKFALSRAFGLDGDAASREGLGRRDSAKEVEREDEAAQRPESQPENATLGVSDANAGDGKGLGSGKLGAPASPSLGAYRPATPLGGGDEEEIDLTEQAFGSDLAAFGEERAAESEEEDLTARNRSHDAAAWTQARTNGKASKHSSQASISAASSAAKRRDFSLDEYSERMRTAAIMLAQLNQSTNAGSQPAVTHNPHVSATAQGGWSSWIIGTSWASNAPNNTTKSEIGQGSVGVKAPVNTSTSSLVASGTAAATASTPAAQTKTTSGPSGAGGAVGATATAGGPSKLIHADTEAIRKRIMQEMMLLEEERMERMKSAPRKVGSRRPTVGVEDEATVLKAVNKDDPSAAMFRETWASKKARIKASSPYGHLPSWDVFSVIVKTGADLRQEQLAVQLINEFGRIWTECKSRIWVRYFRILVTSENSGLMETVTDAVSVHSIKKEAYARAQREQSGGMGGGGVGGGGGKIATYSIFDHFVNTYGDPSSAKFGRARDRFMESLVGYSIISYLLQIKDRHNGNILLSSDGRIIHIDFGFMLGISPGGVGFEAAPFKLTQEYIDILGGLGSPKFEDFKTLMRQGFKDVRKHAERIIMIVELMQKDSKLPCFAPGEFTAANLRDRFALALSASQVDDFVDRLVLASCASSYTRLYDSFQYYSQGIL